jgi:D-hydroxyproline dehydrogenase subunit gamma
MFDLITPCTTNRLVFTFEGRRISADPGTTVAAALLAGGQNWFRETAASGKRRGPYCMMGACFDCLVKIDGVSVQACTVQVRDGLIVSSVTRPAAQKRPGE